MKKWIPVLFLLCCGHRSFSQTEDEWAKKATALLSDGKTAEAIQAYEQILKINPKSVGALGSLGYLYTNEGQFQQGYDWVQKALALAPDDENLWLVKADAANGLAKYDEAIVAADKVIAKDASFYLPYNAKGNALNAQGKKQLAIGQYSKCIQLAPTYTTAFLNRANAFFDISRYENAIKDYDTVLSRVTDYDVGYNKRGMCRYYLKQYDAAVSDYTKAIGLNPKQMYALNNRGTVYLEQLEYEKATADFERSAAISNRYADPLFGLARVYEAQKNYPLSIRYAESAIAIDNSMAPYYAVYSKALLAAGRDEQGLTAASNVLRINDMNPDGYFLKATALSNLKNFTEALAVISAGIEKFPDNYLMYALRSSVYHFQGKTGLAAADDAKAKSLSIKK